MTTQNYKKIASGEESIHFSITDDEVQTKGILVKNGSDWRSHVYKLKKENRVKINLNLDFDPKVILIKFDYAGWDLQEENPKISTYVNNLDHFVLNDSDLISKNPATTTTPEYYQMASIFLEELNREHALINTYFSINDFSLGSYYYTLDIVGCKWVAFA